MKRWFTVRQGPVGGPFAAIQHDHVTRTAESGKYLCEISIEDGERRSIDDLFEMWRRTGGIYGSKELMDTKPTIRRVKEYHIGEPPREVGTILKVQMPSGPIKHVMFKSTQLFAYIEENDGESLREREFVMLLNGSELRVGYEYRGTCLFPLHSIVTHIYEKMLP